AGGGHSKKTGTRSEPVSMCGIFGGENRCSSSIIDAGSVSRGDCPLSAESRLQFCDCFEARVRTWMFVFGKGNRFLFSRNFHPDNFLTEEAGGLCFDCTLLTAEGKRVLVFAGNLEFFGDVFARFRHGIHAVLFFYEWVDETPADRRVVDF